MSHTPQPADVSPQDTPPGRRGIPAKVVKLDLSKPTLTLGAGTAAIAEIALLHQRFLESGLYKFLLLTGQSGCGKSTLLEGYRDAHPNHELEEYTRIPVVYLETPGGTPGVRDVASQILASMGDPAAHKGTVGEKTDRIHFLLDKCGVELILIDEFHNLLKEDRQTPIAKVTSWLKTFINKAKRPIVACGLPRARFVLTENSELNRRLSARHYIEPMLWGDGETQSIEFRAILKALQGRVPIACKDLLYEKNLALRFYFASSGLIDYLIKIVDRAVVVASRTNSVIDREVLAKAFADVVWKGATKELNPFTTTGELRILNRVGEPFHDWESDPGAMSA